MAAPPAWVAGLPSDDEEVECSLTEEPRAADQEVILEDDDVQVVNIVKHEDPPRQRRRRQRQRQAEVAVLSIKVNEPPVLQHSMDFRGDSYRFAAHQHQMESSSKKRKRNEVQQQKRIFTDEDGVYHLQRDGWPPPQVGRERDRRLGRGAAAAEWREEGNLSRVGEPMLQMWRQQEFSGSGHISPLVVHHEHYHSNFGAKRPRDYGVLGGAPASQLRERETIARASGLHFREQGFVVPQERDPTLAPIGCERLLAPPGFNQRRYVTQENFDIIGAPGNGLSTVTSSSNLKITRTRDTRDERWSSPQGTLGTDLSKLHWNIIRFCEAYEISPQQMQMRREALNYVRQTVHQSWPSAEVHLFGSTATGLALPWSDIDVAVLSSSHNDNNRDLTDRKSAITLWMTALSKQLRKRGQVQSLVKIPHAKVPVIKVVFKSGLACDISLDSHNGPQGVPVIRQFMHQYGALHPLCLVLKFFLGQHYLNELYTGGLGSFCLITMVVSYLQTLGVDGTGHDLGALLLSFFTHYSSSHNYRTDVVSTRGAEFCASKQAKGWVNLKDPELLSVEDPLDPTSDIAKGSYRIKTVRSTFLKAKNVLLAHWHHDNVLGMLVDTTGNPNQKPKAQVENSQVIKHPKQPKPKKRKKCGMVGAEMENGQPVKDGKKEAVKQRRLGRKARKQKEKLKKQGKLAAAVQEGRMKKILPEKKVKGQAKRAAVNERHLAEGPDSQPKCSAASRKPVRK